MVCWCCLTNAVLKTEILSKFKQKHDNYSVKCQNASRFCKKKKKISYLTKYQYFKVILRCLGQCQRSWGWVFEKTGCKTTLSAPPSIIPPAPHTQVSSYINKAANCLPASSFNGYCFSVNLISSANKRARLLCIQSHISCLQSDSWIIKKKPQCDVVFDAVKARNGF